MRTRRQRALLVSLTVVAALVVGVAGLVAWQAKAAVDRSDGEPAQVLVATWMRDHELGWLVARLEDVYYATIARPQIGGVPSLSADLAQGEEQDVIAGSGSTAAPSPSEAPVSPSTSASASPSASSSPSPSTSASASPSASVAPTPATTPSPSTGTIERVHLEPPPAIISPVAEPEPKEGVWQPVASLVDGIPAVYATRVRADDVHTSTYASVLWIDPTLADAMFVPGYEEPKGGPNPFDGALAQEYWPALLANVNGGFRLGDSLGGYVYDGEIVRPLANGIASAVVYRDGRIEIGKWGRDFTEVTVDMMAVRQNLALIVDKGVSKVSNPNDHYLWGGTTDKESMAWRSAIGQRADGSILYVAGPALSAAGLADTMVRAGARRAMVLDMNDWWAAAFIFKHRRNGEMTCRKLDPTIAGPCDRFLQRYKRDSFHFLARQEAR